MAKSNKRLRGNYLGIDIGSTNIKLVNTPRDISRPKYRVIDTPSGSFEDGYIRDIPAMAEAIKQCLGGRDRMRGKNPVFSLLSTDIIVRDMEVPPAPPRELPQIVKNMAEEYIPTSLDDYIIDFKPLELINEGETRRQRLLLFAAPRPLVDGYCELADKMRVNISAIDVYQNCIIKASGFMEIEGCKDYLILDVGGKRSVATFFKDKVFSFSRIFDFGGDRITQMISNYRDISPEEAEAIKKNYNAEDSEIDVSTMFENFVGDLTRYVDYYVSRYHADGLEKIILIGGGSAFQPLRGYISESLDLNVVTMDSIMSEPYGIIFNAFGASIREGRA